MGRTKGIDHSDITKEQLESLYFVEKLSMRVIARRLIIADSYVMYLFKKYNIKGRSKSEAIKIGIEQGRVKPTPSGSDNPRWRGQPIITRGGYRAIYCPNHPRGQVNYNYVLEHILVWEHFHGELLKGWVVHHLNGIKSDNRIENLQAMPRKSHHYALLLQGLRKRIRDLEAELNKLKLQGRLKLDATP